MSDSKWFGMVCALLGAIVMAVVIFATLFFISPQGLPESDIEARLREKISIDARDDAFLYNGADLKIYSDDHSTQKLHIDGATGNIDGEGTLDVAGAVTLSGAVEGTTLAASADVDVGTWLNLSARTAISLTAGGIITPTGTYQPLTSAAAVTTSTSLAIANGGETGDALILRNANATDVITIDGVGSNVACKANVALGAGDTLTLIWNGADWNCLANYDNS